MRNLNYCMMKRLMSIVALVCAIVLQASAQTSPKVTY